MRTLVVHLFILGSVLAHAQRDTTWIEYRTGMLHDGVYFGFQDFRNNAPSIPASDLRDKSGSPVKDIRQVVSKLYWLTPEGEQKSIKRDALWGFCQNGAAYVAAGNGFYRLGIMGSLTHMTYEMNYRDWDPYMYPYGGVMRTILMQQLLDMDSGTYLPFNASGIDTALARDTILLEEFRAVPKKQRNTTEVHFHFLRLYNERHPLLFPVGIREDE